jgi:23S rRNA (cytidine1920-2'-O)/16S rRNA (cytidine1409-2'-O)-methyltransferase
LPKIRIDKLLVEQGLAPSRERARALLLAGAVLVNETPVTKAGTAVDPEAVIRVRGQDHPFVSRGGVKLDGALDDFSADVKGLTVLDVGASTGGFTDVCLRRGAAQIYAVDVGTNQLDYRLRADKRVLSMEQTNARHLLPEMLPGLADLAVIDVSFISVTKLLGPVVDCLVPGGAVIAMIKPQFEAGRRQVGKGGVVRDEAVRRAAVDGVVSFGVDLGLTFVDRAESHLKGPKGNQETFVYFKKP